MAKGHERQWSCVSWRLLEQQRQEVPGCEPEQEQARQPEQQHWLPSGEFNSIAR